VTPKDKISTTTIAEWTRALKSHPDLTRDLRACRAMIANERRFKRLWLRMQHGWIPAQWATWPGKQTIDLPSSQYLPVFMTAAWLHERYKPLWNNAPTAPAATFHTALHAAVEAGAWAPAAAIIQQNVANNVAIQERGGFVRVDVFDDVERVQTPEWVAKVRNAPSIQAFLRAGAWPEDIPRYPAILLTITPDATLPQAMKALKTAWDHIKPTLGPQIGTRPEKEVQGRSPDYVWYITIYRLYREWLDQRIAQGAKPSQMAFAKAMSARQLPLQQRAIKLHAVRGGQVSDRLGRLINASPGSAESIARTLRDDVLPLLEPSKSAPSLHDFLVFE